MGDDEAALIKLWKEKRGEVEPEDLSGDLIVQLGSVTEHLNRHWYEKNTGQVVRDVQRQVFHPCTAGWPRPSMAGSRRPAPCLKPSSWNFSEEGAAEKHMSQLQHNMWVIASRTAVLSIITGGGKWVEMSVK